MGVDCSSCGCKDQNEFKLNEVQLDDKSQRKNQVYGGAITSVSCSEDRGWPQAGFTKSLDAFFLTLPCHSFFAESGTDGGTDPGRRPEQSNGFGGVQAPSQGYC